VNDAVHDRVSIYALAGPASVARVESAIRRMLLALLGVADTERHRVRVSPGSGWIEYVDTGQLWATQGNQAIAEPAFARERAESFLREFRSRASTLPATNPGFDPRALLPPLRPIECMAVPARSGRGWDHFLYRAQPTLPLRRGGSAVDVLGTLVEVRIAPGGRIVTLMSRWTPLSGERIEAEFTPMSHGGHHDHGAGHEHGYEQSKLVYVLDGDGIPQYYLAPYHLAMSEHGAIMGASPYSLTVELVVRPLANEPGAKVTAVVAGGSTQYRFTRHELDDGDDEGGFLDLGETRNKQVSDVEDRRYGTSSIILPPGAWIVFVNVKDVRTGAFKHHQQLVFTGRHIGAADID
jgi:hypothetical protein